MKGSCLDWMEHWRMIASISRLIWISQCSSLSLPIERRVMVKSSEWSPLLIARTRVGAVGNLSRARATTSTYCRQKSMSTAWTISKLFALANTQRIKFSSAGGPLSINRSLFNKSQLTSNIHVRIGKSREMDVDGTHRFTQLNISMLSFKTISTWCSVKWDWPSSSLL